MTWGMQRSVVRWTHLVLGIPIIGYVYSPFEEIPQYAPAVRYAFLPALVVTGLWLWQGQRLVRRFVRRPAGHPAVGESARAA